MGISTYVVGFKPADEKWLAMKEIWDSCSDAGVEIPRAVEEFFNYETPDESGVEVELPEHEWNGNETSDGIEIYLDELPKDVKIIRFVNSY